MANKPKHSTPEEVFEASKKSAAALSEMHGKVAQVKVAEQTLRASRVEAYRAERGYAAAVLAEKKLEAKLPPPAAAE